MHQLAAHKPVRRGVTMIELLVVVGIIAILAVIGARALRPVSEGERIREAARAVNVYCGNARNRAAESGRPVGVMFERLERHPHASVTIRQVEVPLPFSGNFQGATLLPWLQSGLFLRVKVNPLQFGPRLIRRGDVVQLNHQGPWYTIVDYDESPGPDEDFPIDVTVPVGHQYKQYIDFFSVGTDVDGDGFIDDYFLTLLRPVDGSNVPWPTTPPSAVPFEILRQPVPSSVEPLELSRGAVVDLAASGFDSYEVLPDWAVEEVAHTFEPQAVGDLRPVIVMFSPTGAVDRVYYMRREYDYTTSPPSFSHCAYLGRSVVEPIHFLVGKWERLPTGLRDLDQTSPPAMNLAIPPFAEDGLYNRQDTSNLWVTLSPQTGLVTVAELDADTFDPNTGMDIPSGATLSEQLYNSRRYAREAQISKGGR